VTTRDRVHLYVGLTCGFIGGAMIVGLFWWMS